ncbi:MAG: serine hydrolase [Pseudomonadota bacterium]
MRATSVPRWALALVLSLAISSPTVGQPASTQAETVHAWLQSYAEDLAAAQDLVGLSIAVTLPNGTTVRVATGLADVELEKPMLPDTRLLGGSTGKTYVAALCLQLSAEGKLDLDAPVQNYLGELPWFAEVPNARTITVQQLLHHSSGIAHYLDDWGFTARFALDRLLGNDTSYSPETMLSFVLGEPALFASGSSYHYSDLNYFLLGLVLEAVSKKEYYELVQSRILGYLDLADTVPSNTTVIPRLATGYAAATLTSRIAGVAGASQVDGVLKVNPAIEWTGGGFATTPGDLSRFYFHLGQGSLPGIGGVDELVADAIPLNPDSLVRYGNGVFVSEREGLGRYFSHTGWYPGYTSNVAYFDDYQFSIALQINQDEGADLYTPVREIARELISLGSPAAQVQRQYSVQLANTIIGSQSIKLEQASAGEAQTSVHYTFQSQGKVTDIYVDALLGADGIPRQMTRSGKAFLYFDIDERFASDGEQAQWNNRVESGNSDSPEGKYYIPYDLLDDGASAPAELALLARAALRRGGEVPLLPYGTARTTVLGWMQVSGIDPAITLDTQLVELSGLSLAPRYIWLDINDASFAEHAGGSIILRGWEHVIEAQTGVQGELIAHVSKARLNNLLRLVVDSEQQPILIQSGSVFNSQTRSFDANTDVLIEDGFITMIGSVDPSAVSAEVYAVDAAGKFLIPGLWDMHVHLNGTDLLKHLAWGVTTVRDLGNNPDRVDALHAGIARGSLIGPTILRAGFIDKSGPIATQAGVLVASRDEALKAVDHFAARGYDQIKLYGAIEAEWIPWIAERSKKHGLRLGGHVPVDGTTARAVADGYDEVQHFIYMWLQFSPEPVELELSFNTARLAKSTPWDSADMQLLIEQFRENEVALDPTLGIYSELLEAKTGEVSRTFKVLGGDLPVQTARAARAGALKPASDLSAEDLSTLFQQAVKLTGKMHAEGVDILVGTDNRALPGAAMHAELELLAEAGIPNADIIYLATSNAASVMNRDDRSGSIAVGQVADIVLLNADPIADISATRDIDAVIRAGVLFDKQALDGVLAGMAN